MVKRLVDSGRTANQITIAALVGSVAVAAVLSLWSSHWPILWLLLPVWLFIRMALNAIDGMMAREFDQKSDVGLILNEVGDVMSDVALFVPFFGLSPAITTSMLAVLILSMLSEFIGVLAASLNRPRNYLGPMGKSDRAFVFGGLAIYIAFGFLSEPVLYCLVGVNILLLITCFRRARAILR